MKRLLPLKTVINFSQAYNFHANAPQQNNELIPQR